jgi:hypothetical protein
VSGSGGVVECQLSGLPPPAASRQTSLSAGASMSDRTSQRPSATASRLASQAAPANPSQSAPHMPRASALAQAGVAGVALPQQQQPGLADNEPVIWPQVLAWPAPARAVSAPGSADEIALNVAITSAEGELEQAQATLKSRLDASPRLQLPKQQQGPARNRAWQWEQLPPGQHSDSACQSCGTWRVCP